MKRGYLRVVETAFLLQMSEMKVRRLADAGELALVGETSGRRRIRIEPESVRRKFPADSTYWLRRRTMDAILSGHLRIPGPTSRWSSPTPLESVRARVISSALNQHPATIEVA